MLSKDEEIRSPKWQVIRVESEETRDYVKKRKEYGKGTFVTRGERSAGKMMGKEPYLRGMWEHFSCERSKAKK